MADCESGAEAYPPIGDYGLIGDCHTAALVSREGSIDWYCPGRFDAPAVLCRVLDAKRGGYFAVAPTANHQTIRRYRPHTNVLVTTHIGEGFRLQVTDFMPITGRKANRKGQDVSSSNRILRAIESLGGDVEVSVRFLPTFDYARAKADIETVGDQGVVVSANQQYLAFTCPGATVSENGTVSARLRVPSGKRVWVGLSLARNADEARAALATDDYDRALTDTDQYWRTWSDGCTFHGTYEEQVLRSALALKLLTYEPTGAIIAAPTTSLPEEIGGPRNWDYRYTWLRDASLLLYSLLTVGYRNEAADFLRWWRDTRQHDPSPDPQIMYRIDGGRDIVETELPHLEGYRCSRPVRIGNAAAKQRQLDIYGEMLASADLYLSDVVHRPPHKGRPAYGPRLTKPLWELLRRMVGQAAAEWQEPDNGIWEVRSGPALYLYSRLMCWVAVDRGIKLAERFSLPAPLDDWRSTRHAIREAILTRGYDEKLGAFTQAFGSTALDASALSIPRLGFLPPTDHRVRSTIARIKSDLMQNGLVYRYRTADGLPGGEGTFALCTFWLVDALALGGQLDEAHELFVHILGYANDLGLLSEEIDPKQGSLLGNFPQGFTHLTLIRSAVNLAKAAKHGPEEEPETETERAPKAAPAAAEGYSNRRQSGRS